jgi:hypothetical protein
MRGQNGDAHQIDGHSHRHVSRSTVDDDLDLASVWKCLILEGPFCNLFGEKFGEKDIGEIVLSASLVNFNALSTMTSHRGKSAQANASRGSRKLTAETKQNNMFSSEATKDETRTRQ